jgi:hypothetical protein
VTKNEIERLLIGLKAEIRDDYRAFDEADAPSMCVTIGADAELREWSYQTGDNSFTGGAYPFPYWGVVDLYRTSNCRALAHAVMEQLREQVL